MSVTTATTAGIVTYSAFGSTDPRELVRTAVLDPGANCDSIGRVCFHLGIPIRRAWPWILDAIFELNQRRGRCAD